MDITAEAISKQYMRDTGESNYFTPVKETSLRLEAGTFTMLSGRSGCGKTTLLSMLCGLLAPSAGKVFCDDTDLYALGDKELSRFRNRNFGVIPQGESALHSLTVLENILLPAGLFPDSKRDQEIKKRAGELLDVLGIPALAEIRPSELSGGELRRMAIARGLILDPPVIFADEPTGDLDDENTTRVFKLLRGLADAGHTVFVVTHEAEGKEYADKIYRMSSGELFL